MDMPTNSPEAQEKCPACGEPNCLDHALRTAPAKAEAQPQGVELLPCPFCRRKSLIEEFHDGDDPQPLFVVTCEVCPVKTYDQFSAQEAIRIWNIRADDRFRDLCRSALAIAKRKETLLTGRLS
jgi:hypothetical protein